MRIDIAYVNPPRNPEGKYGNIKTRNGQTLMVPVAMLDLFQPGMVCDVVTKEQTWGQGADARPVTIIHSGPGNSAAAQAPPPRQAFQPRIVPSGPSLPAKSHDEARQIFITGVVGRAMGSGKFAASEIPILTQAAAMAFDKLFNPKAANEEPPAPIPDYTGAG